MPLENQQIIIFRARGVFDPNVAYRSNDWIAYNGIPYLASRNIAAGNPPNDPDNPTNGWARLGDSVIEGMPGLQGVQGNFTVPVYILSATQPTAPTATWNGINLVVSGGWTETIPSGTGIVWRSDLTLDNIALTATSTGVGRWTGPIGPTPTDTHLNTLISAVLAAAISAGNIQSAAEVLQQIVDYLNNNDYLQESRIQDLINNTLSSLIATDGLIDVDYSTDQVDWLPELAAYRYVRLRGSNPNAPYHIIDLGIVAAQGGTATMLGVNIEYSIDDTTWHDPPRHTDDNWFRFTVGTGGTPSDGLPLSGAGGGGVTNLDVENITGTGFDITSSTGTDASVPAATTTDAGLLTAADKTKLDGVEAGAQVNVDADLSIANRGADTLDIASSTGTDATVPSATPSEAGLQSAADKAKLNSISAGAHVNVDTDLSIANRNASTLDIASSTGTDATVPAATTTEAGLQTAADKTKLDGVETGAEVNVAYRPVDRHTYRYNP